MTDNLRDRIAAVIDREVDGLWEPLAVADAVIGEVLTPEFLADIIIAAIQKAADNE